MRFSTITSKLPVLAALLATASAVDLRAYQGANCDLGAWVFWSGVPAYTCIVIPLSFGLRWYNVPGNALAHAYYDSACGNFAQEGGSGTYCLNEHNNMRSANWFWWGKRLTRREVDAGEFTTGVGYTAPDGTEIRVAAKPAEFATVLDIIKAEDWTALAAYPAV